MRWEHILSKYETSYYGEAIKFKYQCFGVTLDGECNVYAQGVTEKEAFEEMLQKAILRH